MPAFLNYSIEEREGVKVVNLNGNVSALNRDELGDVVNRLAAKSNVIVNLRGVELITSAGMQAFVELSTEARKNSRRVIVMGMPEGVVNLIDRLDLYEHFIFVDSVEEGLMKLRYFT